MTDPNKTWLAAYLYYAEPWEQLLVKAVKPFVESTLADGLAEQFFFIRYWEQGPHIRLRFKGDTAVLENKLKPKLDAYFKKYFRKNPSERVEPEWLKELPLEQVWFPNHSIQYIPYEPEIERYGGPEGILIAEKQFQASSEVVLNILAESQNWSYERALGAAIQLHLGFAYALGMTLEEATAFFTRLFESWFGWGLGLFDYEKNQPVNDYEKQKSEFLELFENQFNLQKKMLLPFHQTLWQALESRAGFENQWQNYWLQGMRDINDELLASQRSGQLNYPPGRQISPKIKVPKSRQLLWLILNSYVHMTNNRLGILNRDEAYLGYLIKQSFEELKSQSNLSNVSKQV